MTKPRVSILIPNYNNGCQSSASGELDFIADLFNSLMTTLEDDPTTIEILVHDDGSSDDSLETCREWANKTWKNGQPFINSFTEGEHTGILSITANKLHQASRGEICVRLDGDIVCFTKNWAQKLCEVFDTSFDQLGVVGPKQLDPDGNIHSAGDWILHARGNHHIAQGAPRNSVTRSIEVDHVMGCFYCYKREVYDDVGGYDETILRGQTVDFGLAARLKGWRTISVPHIEFEHRHSLRQRRETKADTHDGLYETLTRFENKWGFNRLAPDLDEVRMRYQGTPLLWNARVFGPSIRVPTPVEQPLNIEQTEWVRFTNNKSYQAHVRACLNILGYIRCAAHKCNRVLHIQSRAGLMCHLMSKEGLTSIGVDPDPVMVSLAKTITSTETYPVKPPEFHVQQDTTNIPLPDASVDTVLFIETLELHHNPVGLLMEAHRVLQQEGMIGIVTRKRQSPFQSDFDCLHAFRNHEIDLLLRALRIFSICDISETVAYPNFIFMLARKQSDISSSQEIEFKISAQEETITTSTS